MPASSFIVGLALSITLRPIPITGQQKDGQQKNEKQKSQPPVPAPPRESNKPEDKPKPTDPKSAEDLRGTDKAPAVVRILPAPKTQQEAADEKAQRDDESAANWWMGTDCRNHNNGYAICSCHTISTSSPKQACMSFFLM